MTIDEAIEFEEREVLYLKSMAGDTELNNWRLSEDAPSVTEQCSLAADAHRQLAEWLKELKALRDENKKLKGILKANQRDFDYFRMMSEDHGFY